MSHYVIRYVVTVGAVALIIVRQLNATLLPDDTITIALLIAPIFRGFHLLSVRQNFPWLEV